MAPGRSGKSTFAVDLACRMAAQGIDFDGKDIWAQFNVLYIARERARQVRRRANAFCAHHGGPRFDNLLIYDGPLDLMHDGELTAVARMAAWEVQGSSLKEDYIDVVIIDTLAAAMSASDSSPDAMARAVGNLSQCQEDG